MPPNNSWQTQGRQQHGWFGTGTGGIHSINADQPTPGERLYGPLGHVPRADPITPVYPIEGLLGLAGSTLGRTLLSVALRNLGWREPTTRPDDSSPIAGGTMRKPEEPRPNLEIHQGKQDKHIIGKNNYIPGRSILLADAKALVARFAGRGKQVGTIRIGQPGSVEEFDTGDEIIGIWKDLAGNIAETTKGTIRYGKDGVHVVPAVPKGFFE